MISDNDAALCILVGVVGCTVGIVNKTFYAAKGFLAAPSSDKQIPTWLGRLIFLVVGGVFLIAGFSHFIVEVVSQQP